MDDVRCDSGILFGMLDAETAVMETKCRSKRCGARPGIAVIHRFSVKTGKLLSTRKFMDPAAAKGRRHSKEGA